MTLELAICALQPLPWTALDCLGRNLHYLARWTECDTSHIKGHFSPSSGSSTQYFGLCQQGQGTASTNGPNVADQGLI